MKKKFLIFSGFFFLLGSCKNPFGKSSITSLKSSDSPTKDVSPSLNQERPKSDGFRKTEEIRFDTITIDYPFSEEKEDTDRLKTTCSYTSFPDARIITSKESFLSLSDTYPDFRTERKDLILSHRDFTTSHLLLFSRKSQFYKHSREIQSLKLCFPKSGKTKKRIYLVAKAFPSNPSDLEKVSSLDRYSPTYSFYFIVQIPALSETKPVFPEVPNRITKIRWNQ